MPHLKVWEIEYLCTVAYVPQRGQQAMVLRYAEGDSVAAIAGQMRTTAAAVRSLLDRAWEKIQDCDWQDDEAGWIGEVQERAEDPEPQESTGEHAEGLRQAIGDRHLSIEDILRVMSDLRELRTWEAAHPWEALGVVEIEGRCWRRVERSEGYAAKS
jgi:hypothetical protein